MRIKRALFLVTYLATSSSRLEAQVRTPDNVIADIALHNRQISSLSWNCECWDGNTHDGKFTASPTYTRAKVILEPATGRCRFHIESIKQDGQIAKYTGERKIVAFDGRRELCYFNFSDKPEIPLARPGSGLEDSTPSLACSIHPDIQLAHLEAPRTGLAYVLGNTHHGDFAQLVATARKEGFKVSMQQSNGGKTDRIHIVNPQTERIYDFDRSKQCFVGHETIYLGANPHTIDTSRVDLINVNGIWLPRSAEKRHTLATYTQRVTFSNWKVNEFVDEKLFSFEFPSSSRIEDHVAKKIYVIGNSPTNEAKAIRDYMTTYMIAEPLRPWYWNMWIGALTAIVVIGGAGFGLRRYRARIATAILMLTWGTCANADEPKSQHKVECGFQVSVLTLELHRVAYDADQLSLDLFTTEKNGVSLRKLRELFRSKGLEAEARSKLTLADAVSAVKNGWLAIVPVEAKHSCGRVDFGPGAGNVNHYLVLLNHPRLGPAVIDVFRPPLGIEKSPLKNAHFQNPESAVLFVRRKNP